MISITHQGLFTTNETIEGSPGIGQLIATRQVPVTAEMGYWADTAFIPGATDSRVNFYINQDTMTRADRLTGDMPRKPGMNHRRRRDLSQSIDCTALPSSGKAWKRTGDWLSNGVFWIASWLLLH